MSDLTHILWQAMTQEAVDGGLGHSAAILILSRHIDGNPRTSRVRAQSILDRAEDAGYLEYEGTVVRFTQKGFEQYAKKLKLERR